MKTKGLTVLPPWKHDLAQATLDTSADAAFDPAFNVKIHVTVGAMAPKTTWAGVPRTGNDPTLPVLHGPTGPTAQVLDDGFGTPVGRFAGGFLWNTPADLARPPRSVVAAFDPPEGLAESHLVPLKIGWFLGQPYVGGLVCHLPPDAVLGFDAIKSNGVVTTEVKKPFVYPAKGHVFQDGDIPGAGTGGIYDDGLWYCLFVKVLVSTDPARWTGGRCLVIRSLALEYTTPEASFYTADSGGDYDSPAFPSKIFTVALPSDLGQAVASLPRFIDLQFRDPSKLTPPSDPALVGQTANANTVANQIKAAFALAAGDGPNPYQAVTFENAGTPTYAEIVPLIESVFGVPPT